VLVELVFEELGAFGAAVAIVDAEPLRVLLQVNRYFVLVALPVEALVGDGRVGLQMRGQASSDGLGQFWDLSGGLFGGLFLLAFLAGEVEERSSESLRHEVGVDAVLGDAGGGEHLFEGFTGGAWFDELFLRGLGGLVWFCFGEGDVL
jgi:hypothetical protein